MKKKFLFKVFKKTKTILLTSINFIYEIDLQNQNRALHNCTVVFKLISDLPPIRINKKEDSKSLYYSDMIKVYVKKGEAFASPEEINRKIEQEITKKKDSEKKNSDSSEWETEEENINTNKKPTKKINENSDKKKIGEVVYIMKNDYNDRDIIGKIEISEGKDPKTKNQNNQTKINYVFIPNDKRLPKMFINKMGDEPYDLIAKHEIKLENSYFIGKLLEWPNYSFYPHVEITGYLGIAGDIENECKALLLENKVFVGDFEEKTREHLSEYENGNWEIPNEEKNKRMNLTKSLICTIDPSTARDLDDALSIEEITPGVYEIGVHIADVSYFIKENDPVDSEARKRTTSVYLPHRVIPMLPGILCEKLCSLNPGVERLAFSIFFKMNENGDWLKNEAPRIGKSIIKSCGKLSYEVAQMIIEGDIKQIEEVPEICKVDKTIDGEKLLQGIKKMNEIAQKRRAFRVKNGSLQFNKKKKKFQLNEQNIPVTFSIEEVLIF